MEPTRASDSAFPIPYDIENLYTPGLTKLEYFAGLAMQGLLAQDYDTGFQHGSQTVIADAAVALATALIDRLNGEQQDPQAPEINPTYRGIGRTGLPLEY